jgi:hypothetical protein
MGKWKMNPGKSNFGESTMTYEALPDGSMKTTMDGQSYTFKTDGKEVPTPWGTTMAVKAVDAKTWDVTEKSNGKVSMSSALKLSDDGKTLTMDGKRMKADGGTANESMTMTRVSGGPGLAGKWKFKNMSSNSPVTLELSPNGADGVKIVSGDMGGVCDAKFDGKDHPASGTLWPKGWTCNVSKSGSGLAVTWKRDAKPMYEITWMTSADGKTLTESGTPAGVNERFAIVYDRQ